MESIVENIHALSIKCSSIYGSNTSQISIFIAVLVVVAVAVVRNKKLLPLWRWQHNQDFYL